MVLECPRRRDWPHFRRPTGRACSSSPNHFSNGEGSCSKPFRTKSQVQTGSCQLLRFGPAVLLGGRFQRQPHRGQVAGAQLTSSQGTCHCGKGSHQTTSVWTLIPKVPNRSETSLLGQNKGSVPKIDPFLGTGFFFDTFSSRHFELTLSKQ